MQKQIYFGMYFEIETSAGTEIVPSYIIGRTAGTAAEAFANYCEGNILDTDDCIECKEGWLGRMTMPGYLDCTDWIAFKTERAAMDTLDEYYGESDEC